MAKERLVLPKDVMDDMVDVQDIKNPMFGGINFLKQSYCLMFWLMYKCSLNKIKMDYHMVMKNLDVEQSRANGLISRFSDLSHNGHAKFLIKDRSEHGKYLVASVDTFEEIIKDYPKIVDKYREIKGFKK